MNNKIDLSIIIPVYNVAPFLKQSLDSIFNIECAQIEVIIVNDGATDGSAEIVHQYCVKYAHRCRRIDQKNAGVAAARNAGIDIAQGEYVAFFDPDDWVVADYYPSLLRLAKTHSLDIAHGNAIYHFEGRSADCLVYQDDLPETLMSGYDTLRYRLSNKTLRHMSCFHLYRRSMLEQDGLRFVRGRLHEDVPWLTKAFLLAGRVMYNGNPGYFYRQRIRHFNQEETDARFEKIIYSSIANILDLEEMAVRIDSDPELASLIRWQLVDGGLSVFHKLSKIADPSARRRIRQYFREQSLYRTLWRNATLFSQHRRIARNWLQGLLKA